MPPFAASRKRRASLRIAHLLRLIVALATLVLAAALTRHLIAGTPSTAHTATAVGLLLAALAVCLAVLSWRRS